LTITNLRISSFSLNFVIVNAFDRMMG